MFSVPLPGLWLLSCWPHDDLSVSQQWKSLEFPVLLPRKVACQEDSWLMVIPYPPYRFTFYPCSGSEEFRLNGRKKKSSCERYMAAKRTGISGLGNTFHHLRWSWTLANTPVRDKEQSCEWGKDMNETANYKDKRRRSFGMQEFQRNESKCVKAGVCY